MPLLQAEEGPAETARAEKGTDGAIAFDVMSPLRRHPPFTTHGDAYGHPVLRPISTRCSTPPSLAERL